MINNSNKEKKSGRKCFSSGANAIQFQQQSETSLVSELEN